VAVGVTGVLRVVSVFRGDAGDVLVVEDDRLVGTLTDRAILVRWPLASWLIGGCPWAAGWLPVFGFRGTLAVALGALPAPHGGRFW